MFAWRVERANARATEARNRYRDEPGNAEAERAAYDTMGDYVRAARERNNADRRRREQAAQALASSLKDRTYVDPRPPQNR
jgi:hypothetical protein